MALGNDSYNLLYNPEEKHYENTADNIDLNNKNNSLTLVVSAINEGTTVLDVGCSFGYIGEWLIKNKNCTLYGIDIDNVALEVVKQKGFYKDAYNINLDKLFLETPDLERFLSSNVKFDYIICADVIEHFLYPTEALKLLGSKLKKGGSIVVSIPNFSNMDIILNLIEERFNYSKVGLLDNTHARFYTLKSFAEWIYNSNSFFKDFKFDVKNIGFTTHRTELAQSIKDKYPYIYDLLYNSNTRLEVFQNIFLLTKLDNQDTAIELDSLIKSYKMPLKKYNNDISAKKASRKIHSKSSYSFNVNIPSKHFKSISLLFGMHNKINKGSIAVNIYKAGEKFVFAQKVINTIYIEDNNWYEIDFGDLFLPEQNMMVKLETNLDEDEGFSIYLNNEGLPCMRFICYEDEFKISEASEDFNTLNSIENQLREKFKAEKYYKNKCKYLNEKDEKYKENIERISSMVSLEDYENVREENKKLRRMLEELLQSMINK